MMQQRVRCLSTRAYAALSANDTWIGDIVVIRLRDGARTARYGSYRVQRSGTFASFLSETGYPMSDERRQRITAVLEARETPQPAAKVIQIGGTHPPLRSRH